MSTTPAAPAGDVAVICVELFTVKDVASTEPNLTVLALVKLVPVMTTELPPLIEPAEGVTPVIVGGGKYEYLLAATTEDVPTDVVTLTSTVPAVPLGTFAVISVPKVLTAKSATLSAVDPKDTPVKPTKFVPVMTTLFPPAAGPLLDATAVTAGEAMG